jgi:hypothetical protein
VWAVKIAYNCAHLAVKLAVLVFAQCQPLHYMWDEPLGVKGTCMNLQRIDIGAGAAVALADLMLLVLPMPMFISLTSLPLRKKMLLCGLFAVGLVYVYLARGSRDHGY